MNDIRFIPAGQRQTIPQICRYIELRIAACRHQRHPQAVQADQPGGNRCGADIECHTIAVGQRTILDLCCSRQLLLVVKRDHRIAENASLRGEHPPFGQFCCAEYCRFCCRILCRGDRAAFQTDPVAISILCRDDAGNEQQRIEAVTGQRMQFLFSRQYRDAALLLFHGKHSLWFRCL